MTDRDLVAALRGAGIADVDGSGLARALYSTDGSLYRVHPRVVVRPRHADEVAATLAVCRERGVPLTARGAGTSIAGNAVGSGVVLDTSRHLHRVRSVDAEARTAEVDPGVVQASLQAAAHPAGLRFGPDPSTHNRCTLGGMIGNNACGSRALGYGRTSDNVVALDVVLGTGTRVRLSDRAPDVPELAALRALAEAELATIRTELGRFGRQVSGYALEHLLPEHGFDVAKALVGSEGTLGLVVGATVRLVPEPAVRGLVVLGYPSMPEAADATPGMLPHGPTAVEGLDSRMVQRLRDVPAAVVPDLPRGSAWLVVELTGATAAEVGDKAARVVADSGALDSMVVTDIAHATAIWRIREDGAGLAGRTSDGRPAHAGWEDAAVPVERLGDYLRDFEELLTGHGLQCVPYGHFGDGCVHGRIDFPFGADQGADDRGRAVYRAFIEDAAGLVARYGGSVSGEHGDGRARSELLRFMYSDRALGVFAQVKGLLDPDDVLNPGVLVRPASMTDAVRTAEAPALRTRLALAYRHDDGDFSKAVHRCTGVGKCRADLGTSGVMCPSWPATRQEKDNTRGRARVLQEMLAPGGPVRDWRSPEVHEALDLCLSCKGCSRDCPTGVDMASYKAEVLHQSYRRRVRPRSHYALGQLPRWADAAALAPGLANAVTRSRVGGRVARWAAGVDQRRSLPAFAPRTFRQQWRGRQQGGPSSGNPVVLWVDTFTDHFAPAVGLAAARVLEAAGYSVVVPPASTCCGLTWITTGQLTGAKRILGRTVRTLDRAVSGGIPVVGLEPSCTAVLRGDAVELLDDPAARRVADGTRTLAELLGETPGWTPPSLDAVTAVAQPHCHHHAVMGWTTDERLLRDAGASVTRLGGCCGLAGNWGVERGHHDVSVSIAGQQLLPAVEGLPEDGVVLADGFSCRTQLDHLAGRTGRHLAEVLAERLP